MSGKKLTLLKWATAHGVHYRTALAWVREGKMPSSFERTPGGHIRVSEAAEGDNTGGRSVLYGRVSSSDQKTDLSRQLDRLRSFACGKGFEHVEVIEEIGSGLNGHRIRLLKVLADPGVQRIVVEHRDRLARFGVEYIEAALKAQGRELLIVEAGEQKLDIVQDFFDLAVEVLVVYVEKLHFAFGELGRELKVLR